MSNIDDRLRSDAARIEVTVPTSVRDRLAQRLSAAEQKTSSAEKGVSGWWPVMVPTLRSVWGPQLATGMLVVVALAAWLMIAIDRPEERAITANTQVATEAPTEGSTEKLTENNNGAETNYEDPVARLAGVMAGQTAPEAELQNELQSLNADWRRIRSRVRNQIDPLL